MPDDHQVQLPPILLPGYESRQQARAIIWLTVLVPAVGAFLFIAAPPTMGGFSYELDPLGTIVPLAGVGMCLVGLLWMVRIYRTTVDVEPDHGNWRYRSR